MYKFEGKKFQSNLRGMETTIGQNKTERLLNVSIESKRNGNLSR